MTSFHNAGEVYGQVGTQHVHGDVNYYHLDGSSRRKRRWLEQDGSGSSTKNERALDDEILASLAFPEMFYRRNDIRAPHQKTCQWIFDLEQYNTWNSQSSGLLWIKGKPGAGKSTLMAHLYHAVSRNCSIDRTVCLEFFFTARGTLLQRTMLGMLRSVLCQVFRHDVDCRSAVRNAYRENKEPFGSATCDWEWRQPELERLLTTAILSFARRKPLVLFIDALDEAGKEAARYMTRYFHDLNDQLCDQSLKAKICISCRHFPIVPKFGAIEVCVERHNQDDIAAYIRGHLNRQALLQDEISEDADWEALVRDLLSDANGVFQWVCLVVELVEDFLLRGDSPTQVRQWLKQVPKELGRVYKEIIEQLIVQSHEIQSYRLFQWVCLATYPLSVTEIRSALACHNALDWSDSNQTYNTGEFIDTDELMVLRIRSWSGGLIEVVTSDEFGFIQVRVQPIHQSVNDFCLTEGLAHFAESITKKQEKVFSTMACDSNAEIIASCHRELYGTCLKYMSQDAVHFTPRLPSDGGIVEEEIRSYHFPLLEYAVLNCFEHARELANYRSRNLVEEAVMLKTATPTLARAAGLFHAQGWLAEAGRYDPTPLHVTAAANMPELIPHLLDLEIDVDAVDTRGRTALHHATRWGYLETIKVLVRHKADVQKKDRYQSTPILLAAECGHTEVVTWLLSHNPRLNISDTSSTTPLYAAARNGHISIVRLCLELGADVNAQGGYFGNALQAASARGRQNVVQVLLDAGAEVNREGGRWGNALRAAKWHHYRRIIQLLLDAGADVNAQGDL